METGLLEMNN
jgi:hypothetical protein